MDDKRLSTLNTLVGLLQDGITKEEFTKAFEALMAVIAGKSTELGLKVDGALRELRDSNEKTFATAKGEAMRLVKEAIADQQRGMDLLRDKVRRLKNGYTPIKGKDYFDGEDGYTPVKGVDYFDGKDAVGVTGDEIIAKINTAEDLISKEAVEGMKELEKAVNEKTGNTVRVGWGAHPLVIQGLGVVIDKNTRVLNFAGSGLTSVVRSKNGVVTVTLQAGGAGSTVYTETPTGLVNGVNTTYTTANTINTVYNLAIGPQFLHPTTDYTVTGSTITMVAALDASLSSLPFTITYA